MWVHAMKQIDYHAYTMDVLDSASNVAKCAPGMAIELQSLAVSIAAIRGGLFTDGIAPLPVDPDIPWKITIQEASADYYNVTMHSNQINTI